jgi:hypothetical protein
LGPKASEKDDGKEKGDRLWPIVERKDAPALSMIMLLKAP